MARKPSWTGHIYVSTKEKIVAIFSISLTEMYNFIDRENKIHKTPPQMSTVVW